MATATYFEQTSTESYDRHEYAIEFGNGRRQLFGDYETMRNFWWSHIQLIQLSKMTVSVLDKKPTSIGFK